MKKSFLLILFGLFTFVLFAQKIPKRLLIEHFTSANCGPCALADPYIQRELKENADRISYLRLQFNAPSADIMYNQNPSDVAYRAALYGVNAAPTVICQGKKLGSPYFLGDSIAAALMDSSVFHLSVSHMFNIAGDTAFMTVTLKAVDSFTATDSLRLVFSLNEDLIEFDKPAGSNGEKVFPHVMRKLSPLPLGMNIKNNWEAGDSVSYHMAIPIPGYVYHKDRLECLAFIQDKNTKEILQSELSSAYRGVIITNVVTENVNYSTAPWHPEVTILNDYTTTTVSSLKIKYQLNQGAIEEFDWTAGTLLPNKTIDIKIPDLSSQLISGKNVLNFEIMMDEPELFPGRKISLNLPVFVFNHYQDTASGQENFDGNVFPPVGYTVLGDTFNWEKSSNAGNAFIKAACQNKQGASTLFYLPPQKIAENNALLAFSVAYAGITSKNTDTLSVQISEDNGSTWKTICALHDKLLETSTARNTPIFIPSSSKDWKYKRYSLQDYAGKNVLVRFAAISCGMAPIYLDSIFLGDKAVNFNIETKVDPNFAGVIEAPASAPALSYVTVKAHLMRNVYYFHYWMSPIEEILSRDSVYTFQIKEDINLIAFFSMKQTNKDAEKVFMSYNNPVHDMLILTSGDQVVEQLIIYDLNGKELWLQKPCRILSNEKIDLTGFPSGVYLIRVQTNEGTEVIKITKR